MNAVLTNEVTQDMEVVDEFLLSEGLVGLEHEEIFPYLQL